MYPVAPVLSNFDPSNIAHYPTAMHIEPSYDSFIPHSSPIDRTPNKSGERNYLGDSEVGMYCKKAISLSTSVSIGDTLYALATNINTQDQLRVVIRYLMRYCQTSSPGEVILHETLKTMKEESTDNINQMGGADGIVERALEHHFGETDEVKKKPSIRPEEDYDELNYLLARIKNIDLLLNGVKELYQDLFITE
jgi:hypothetical protein